MNYLICLIFGHKFKYTNRSNGNFWGWNVYKCERCNKQIDSLTN